MEKIRVGIIGTGITIGIARTHVRGYAQIEDCLLTALYDIVPERAHGYVEKLQLENVTVCDDLATFLMAVDAVSICTHNSSHVELMEQCLAAGKHVITEKPLADTLKDAEKALAFEERYPGLVSMVVFNYREKPGIACIRDLLEEGKLGRIFYFRYILGGNRIGNAEGVGLEWRMQKKLSGSGALADFGCHMLELVDYLASPSAGKIRQVGCFTETFVRQRAHMETGVQTEVTNDDASVIIAKTEGGCLCSLTACRLAIPYEAIEICGEGGSISHILQSDSISTHFKPYNGAFSSMQPEQIRIDEKYQKLSGHMGVLNEFINCIKTGAKPYRSVSHGYYIQSLLDALERSAQTGTLIEV